ncbi:MAG: MFS transporter [Chitinophagia bacterium]|jgi:MFS family permease|nr:MFS transporter [Chitinophagia bacterium]
MKKFYCWIVLACLFLMYMASNGIVLNTFNLYLPEFAKEFGVDIGKATGLAATLYLVLALPLPFVGNLLEKYSPKKLIIIGAFGTSLGLFFLAKATQFSTIQLFVIVYPLFLCLVGLLTSMYVINNWFVKYKGIATGILLMASSVGPAIFAPIVGKWIKTMGWHAAAQNQFILCSCLIILPALLLYSHPSNINSYADGIPGTVGRQPVVDKTVSRQLLKKALSSAEFYLVALVTAALWFCIGGFIQNQRNYQADLHLDVAQSGQLQGLFFLFGLLGKLLFGYLGDKFSVKKIMLISVANMLAGCLLLYWSLQDSRWIIPCAIIFGLGYSGTFTMIQLYIIDLFGGAAYGSILGALSFIDTICASVGVAVLGGIRKTSGNYEKAFLIMIILTVFSLLATYLINQRAKKGLLI